MKARRQVSGAINSRSFGKDFAASWKQHWQRHQRALELCRKKPSKRKVHELRTATRRLQAHLELIRIETQPSAKKARHVLRKLMQVTGPVRDAQVQVTLLKQFAGKHVNPEVKSFRLHLKKRRAHQVGLLAGKLSARRFRKDRPKAKQILPAQPSVVATRNLQQAAVRLQRCWARARNGAADTRHQARVALKRLHYMAEIVFPGAAPRSLHAAQAELGRLHDLDLFLQHLQEFAKDQPVGRIQNTAARQRRNVERRAQSRLSASCADLIPRPLHPDRNICGAIGKGRKAERKCIG